MKRTTTALAATLFIGLALAGSCPNAFAQEDKDNWRELLKELLKRAADAGLDSLRKANERQTRHVDSIATPAYGFAETVGTFTVERAYPFLVEDKLLTSAVHLCGQKLGGRQTDLVQVRLSNSTEEAIKGIRVEVVLQGYSEPTVKTISLEKGESKEMGFTPVFKDVGSITEITPAAIAVKVSHENLKIPFEDTKRISLMSRNDILLGTAHAVFQGTVVTPNDKLVNQLISFAAEYAPGRSIAGYQRDASFVLAEIKSVYDTVSQLGVHYRSTTTSFMSGKDTAAQRLTFPAESISGTGANCLDGTVLFASAFEAMGLDTYLVHVPGHAFVGAKLDPKSSQILFLETTMVGSGKFEDAVSEGGRRFNDSSRQGKVVLYSLKQVRDAGITPFPYSLGRLRFPEDRIREARKALEEAAQRKREALQLIVIDKVHYGTTTDKMKGIFADVRNKSDTPMKKVVITFYYVDGAGTVLFKESVQLTNLRAGKSVTWGTYLRAVEGYKDIRARIEDLEW